MPYSLEFQNQLTKMVTDLGGKVHSNNEFSFHITHMVRPVGTRTMKTLASALTQRWLVSPEWITESFNQGGFISEEGFGMRAEERPFHGSRFYFDGSFISENTNTAYKVVNTKTLIELGQGTIVDQADDSVDYTLVGAQFDAGEIKGQALSWPQFIGMIPGAKDAPAANDNDDKTTKRKREPADTQEQQQPQAIGEGGGTSQRLRREEQVTSERPEDKRSRDL